MSQIAPPLPPPLVGVDEPPMRRVQRHLDTYAPSEQENLLLWLDVGAVT